MTQVKDPLGNVVSVVYDSAGRVGTITLPDRPPRNSAPFQEQGWTNSGTSGSPAPATLFAAAAASYTNPNGNTTTVRPDWYGLGTVGRQSSTRWATSTPTTSTPTAWPSIAIDPLNRITQYTYDTHGNMTDDRLRRRHRRSVHLQQLRRAADLHQRRTAIQLQLHLRRPRQPDGHQGPDDQPDDADLHRQRPGADRSRTPTSTRPPTSTTARTG